MGDDRSLGALLPEVSLANDEHLVLTEALSGEVTLQSRAALVYEAGILRDGVVRIELAEFPGKPGQITLHVRDSDLPPGDYEDVGTWRQVIVGDSFRDGIPR